MWQRLIEWNKNRPNDILIVAAVLAILGFSLSAVEGILHLIHDGNPWYLIILLAGISTLVFCLRPIWSQLVGIVKENQNKYED